jgi:hypothetical protein
MKATFTPLTLLLVALSYASPAWVRYVQVSRVVIGADSASAASKLAATLGGDSFRPWKEYWVAQAPKPTGAIAPKDIAAAWAAHPETSIDPVRQFGYQPSSDLVSVGRGKGSYVVYRSSETACAFPALSDAQGFVAGLYTPFVALGRGFTYEESLWTPDTVYPSGPTFDVVQVSATRSMAVPLPWAYWDANVSAPRVTYSTTAPSFSVPVDPAILDDTPTDGQYGNTTKP